MKNINKFTKAELISKIQGLNSQKQIESNSSLFSILMTSLLLIKSFLLKITLIAVIIKIFKTYSILRRIWSLFSTILFSIFGISLIDIYEIEFLSKFFNNLLDIFSNFHTKIFELFGKPVEVPIKTPTKMGSMNRIDQSSTTNQESNKIIERFNQLIHKEPEVVENTPFYKDGKTYIYIGGILLLLGLGYYFWEDLTPIPGIIIEKLNSFRRKPGSNGSNPSNDNTTNSTWNLKKSLKDWWNKDKANTQSTPSSPSSPSSINSIQLDPSNNSPVNSLDHFLPKFDKSKWQDLGEGSSSNNVQSLLDNITGERQEQFNVRADVILSRISVFTERFEDNQFSTNEFRLGMYNAIRGRLLSLSALSPVLYENLIQNDKINNAIDNFVRLENEMLNHLPDDNSDTYDEVAKATIQEQDVWSDKANTPSVHSLLLSPITNLVNEATELSDNDLMKKVKEVFKEDIGLKLDMTQDKQMEVLQPEIIVNDNSGSNSSLDHYLPETEIPQLEEIRAKRLEKFVDSSPLLETQTEVANPISSPHISQVGLGTPIQDRLNTSPLIHKTSMTNLFDDTMNLFDDDPTGIDTSGESSQKEVINQGSSKSESIFGNLFSQIKSHRKEYGSPKSDIDKSVEDPIDSDSNDEKDSPQDKSNIFIPENIKFNIKTGDISNRFIDFDFGEQFDKISKIMIITNDGYNQYFDPHYSKNSSLSIKWDNKGITNPNSKDLEVFKIYIMFKNDTRSNQIYSNPNVHILDSFNLNSGKSF